LKTKLLYLWESLQSSLWFVPLIIVMVAVGTAFGLIYLDSIIDYKPTGLFQYFFSGGAESARSILSTIAGAMLTVAGTVFSMTLVALTLASSQFGSRMLRNFMHDRLNQIVLGAYIATFVYCLLVLRTVKSEHGIDFVPNVSVLFAIFVAITNIFLLILFIHHISVSIQADQVISDISDSLDKSIKTLFPEALGEENEEDSEEKAIEIKKSFSIQTTVVNTRNGYLEAIDNETLMNLAKENDLFLTLEHRPGDFLVSKMELVQINSKTECDDEIKQKIERAFILGNKRTPIQDSEFAIHQIVEIAARALSPGINDPYTAITCIDKLTSAMGYLTRANFPSAYRYDREGQLRVITNPLTFHGMMDASFNQIRQYGKGSPAVLIRLMEVFIIINGLAGNKNQKSAVERHAAMVYRACESSHPDANDLNDLKERYDRLLKN